MRKFGLIGFPLTHSFSKKYFEEKFRQENISDCSYDLFELKSIAEFPKLLREHPGLSGLNVTIPFKESVMQFLEEVDDVAKEVGAVNCIKIKNGKLKGYNTDIFGFETSLKKVLTENPKLTFVLGSGGSSKAVNFVLKKLSFASVTVSRSAKENCISYWDLDRCLAMENRMSPVLLINTTPLGMFPNIQSLPALPYEKLKEADYLFDLVYNPAETLFLQKGRTQGAKTKNGLEMLELQAEKSWEIWNS